MPCVPFKCWISLLEALLCNLRLKVLIWQVHHSQRLLAIVPPAPVSWASLSPSQAASSGCCDMFHSRSMHLDSASLLPILLQLDFWQLSDLQMQQVCIRGLISASCGPRHERHLLTEFSLQVPQDPAARSQQELQALKSHQGAQLKASASIRQDLLGL